MYQCINVLVKNCTFMRSGTLALVYQCLSTFLEVKRNFTPKMIIFVCF